MNHVVHHAYLGLGSNTGDSKLSILTALQHLHALPESDIAEVSGLYRSPPWGYEDQPDFLNAAAELTTTLHPQQLLHQIKHIEYELMGRVKTARWGPRTIDIDLLLYDDLAYHSDDLQVPHPHLMERCFVLKPLTDLQLKLPKKEIERIQQALKDLDCTENLDYLEPLKPPNVAI